MSIKNLDLLVVAPHPDDAEIFAGGLLAKMASYGYQTGVVDLSRAELSSRGNKESRKRETETASAILNLSYRVNLELPNCGIFDEPLSGDSENLDENSAIKLAKVFRETRPGIIALPYPADRHPDHGNAARLAWRAVFMSNLGKVAIENLPIFDPPTIIFYQLRTEFSPDFIVDISDSFETKYRAISAYATQFSPDDDKPTLLSSPLSLSALKVRDSYLGSKIGVQFAEGYISRASVRIDNPVKHFKDNSINNALYFKDIHL